MTSRRLFVGYLVAALTLSLAAQIAIGGLSPTMAAALEEPVITSYAKAPARTITAGGVTYAYRELGPKGGIPVVFFVHLAATLDNWDPRIIDPDRQGAPRHRVRQPRRRRLHRPGSRQRRGDG